MPAKSKQQQKFMGIVRSIQKGEAPAGKFSKAAQKAAKSMKKGSVRKYAKTKHDDLPKKVKEEKKRDYKAEYKKFQSSSKMKKYRAELNKYNRKKGTYGNGDGKDASHKGGKIVGFEAQSKNRGRAEKSRLKKESLNEREMSIKDAFQDLVKDHGAKKALDMLADVLTGGALAAMDSKKVKAFKKKLLKKVTTEAKYKGYDYKRQKRKDGLSLIVPALRKTFSDMKDLKKYIDKHGTMESKLNENPAAIAAAQRMVVQNKQGKKVSVNTARQSTYKEKDPSAHRKAKSLFQRIKDRFSKKESVNEQFFDAKGKFRKYMDKVFKQAGIRVIKYDPMKKNFYNGAWGGFYTVESNNKVDIGGRAVKRSSAVLPVYISRIGQVELGVSAGGFHLGKAGSPQVLKNLKDFKKTDLDESADVKKYFVRENLREMKDPQIISKIRDVVKNRQNQVITDPVSKRKMRMDGFTANAIIQVYDKINTRNKKKFSALSLPKMQQLAMKFIK